MNRLSLYIFYGLLAYMPFHIFLSTWLGTSFGVLEVAKIAKDIILVIGALSALVISVNKTWFKLFLRNRLVWLVLGYAALNVVLALIKPTDQDAEILGVVYNTRFLMFFLYAWLLTYHFEQKYLIKRAVQIVLISGGVVATLGIVQYSLLPNDALTRLGYSRQNGVLPAFFIDEKPDLERVMSTLRDPNSLGSYLIITTMLSLAYLSRASDRQWRIIALFLTGVGLLCLWLTFSRSAWLGVLLAVGAFVAFYRAKLSSQILRFKKPILYAGVAFMTLFLAGVVIFKDSYLVKNVIFHADESTVLEDPNELRVRFWRESVEGIARDPGGSGPGTAGLASIRNEKQGVELNENYYLQIGSELGVIGLALFLIIVAIVAYELFLFRTNALALSIFASLAGLMLTNFLVHIWSNEAVAYTWWGLAGVFLRGNLRNSHNKSRKA